MNAREMYHMGLPLLAMLVVVAGAAVAQQQEDRAQPAGQQQGKPEWSMNATAIEACSCPMFCPCYFNTEPASHGSHGAAHGEAAGDERSGHFCLFNMAYKVNKGHHGQTKLDGAKFWISGDLGESWSDGEMEWALVRFDSAVR